MVGRLVHNLLLCSLAYTNLDPIDVHSDQMTKLVFGVCLEPDFGFHQSLSFSQIIGASDLLNEAGMFDCKEMLAEGSIKVLEYTIADFQTKRVLLQSLHSLLNDIPALVFAKLP